MPIFSAMILTATPPGQSGEQGGAYAKIDGREALLRAVELFLNRENVTQIQLIVAPEQAEMAKQKFGANLAFTGVKMVVGGSKWIEQIIAGFKTVAADATHVLVHDAARPAVPYSDIDAVLAESEKHEAVVLASAIRATLLELDDGDNALATHPPHRFMQLLTPQVYSRKIVQTIAASGQEPHPSSLTVVKGSPLNVRLGAPGEAGFAKAMIAMLPKPKIRSSSSPFEEAQW